MRSTRSTTSEQGRGMTEGVDFHTKVLVALRLARYMMFRLGPFQRGLGAVVTVLILWLGIRQSEGWKSFADSI
jgi:hypothetical protein